MKNSGRSIFWIPLLAVFALLGFAIGAQAQSGGTLTLNGNTTDAGDISFDGGATLNLDSGTLNTGSLTIASGTLVTNGGIFEPSGQVVSIGTGSFNLGSGSLTVGSSSSSSSAQIVQVSSGTLVLSDGTYQAIGSGSLVLGSGSLTLSSGIFTTSEILLEDTLPVGLSFGLQPTQLPALNLNNGSPLHLSFDTSTRAVGTLDLSGNLSLNNTPLTIDDLASIPTKVPLGTVFDLIQYSGTEIGEFTINGTAVPDGGTFQLGSNTFQLDYAVGDPMVLIMAVPEPSSWIMLACGLGLLAVWRRWRRA